MTTRSRRGCLTCRKRKLKCDEQRPICGHCSKASRECIPSEGVVFRNHQNPSMNSAGGAGGNLQSFFSYKNTFNKDTVWVDIPSQVEFVHVLDPYADDQAHGDQRIPLPRDSTASYQNIASHSLEALSTAATANPPAYAQHGSYADNDGTYVPYNSSHSEYLPTLQKMTNATNASTHHSNNNINFLLNPANSLASVIDPNLEASVQHDQEASSARRHSQSPRIGRRESKHDITDPEQRVAYLLRGFSDTTGQGE